MLAGVIWGDVPCTIGIVRELSILLITREVTVHSSVPRDGRAETCQGLERVL